MSQSTCRLPNRRTRRSGSGSCSRPGHVRLLAPRLEDRLAPATFIVANSLDGPVNKAGDLPGSLRQAVFDANAAATDDIVQFDENEFVLTELISLQSEIEIKGATLITAAKLSSLPTITGSDLTRLFTINAPGADVAFEKLQLNDGKATVGGGGAILADDAKLVSLTNCIIQSSSAPFGGGIAATGPALSLTKCEVILNTATTDGGGIWVDGGSLTVSGGDFRGDTATLNGGAIWTNAAEVVIQSTKVGGCLADTGGGGACYFKQGTVVIGSSTISVDKNGVPNQAQVGGGLFSDGAKVTINSKSVISKNESFGDGGGIAASGQLAVSGESVIERNLAAGSGGGIYFFGQSLHLGSLSNAADCGIQHNGAGLDGGGIRAVSGAVSLIRTDVCFNYASNTGGGISIVGGSLGVNGGEITLNISQDALAITPQRGGGIYSEVPTVLTDCVIQSNAAIVSGGGVEVTTQFGRLTMQSCIVVSDSSVVTNAGIGGGVNLSNDSLTPAGADVITGTLFQKCQATFGGGLAVTGRRQVTVSAGSKFDTCQAFNDSFGGGAYLSRGATDQMSPTVTFSGSLFSTNGGQFGAGLAIRKVAAAVTVTDCTFVRNQKNVTTPNELSRGGAIYVTGETTPAGSVLITGKSNLSGVDDDTRNEAVYGGAVAVHDSNATVTIQGETTIAKNSAQFGGGVSVTGTGAPTVSLNQVDILGNSATLVVVVGGGTLSQVGGGVYVAHTDAVVSFQHCKLAGNEAPNSGGGMEITGTGTPTVTLIDCTIGGADAGEGNVVSKVTGSGNGGGIDIAGSQGVISLLNCTFQGNRAFDGDGSGGAIAMTGALNTIDLMMCKFYSNAAQSGSGGAVYISATPFDVENSAITFFDCTIGDTFSGTVPPNAAGLFGGGVAVIDSSIPLTIDACTLAENAATHGGGLAVFKSSNFSLTNSTLSGNTVDPLTGGRGGGAYLYQQAVGNVTVMTNCTVSGNKAVQGGGVFINANGAGPGNFTIFNSTLTNNSASTDAGQNIGLINFRTGVPTTEEFLVLDSTIAANDGDPGGQFLPDIRDVEFPTPAKATVIANFSFIGVFPDDLTIGVVDNESEIGSPNTPIFPLLRPLLDNGGLTKTHEPIFVEGGTKSPVIDAGRNFVPEAFDQRGPGFNRRVNFLDLLPYGLDRTDIGAFERSQSRYVIGVKVEANPGVVQQSRVTLIRVTFSLPVSFPAGVAAAFQLERTAQPSGGPQASFPLGVVNIAAVATNATTVDITFLPGGTVPVDPSNSLIDGVYKLTVIGSNVQGSAGLMDGDADGEPGGNLVIAGSGGNGLFRLFGDSDGDGDVDAIDFAAFRGAFGSSNPVFDADGDGDVDAQDFGAFRARFGASVPI